MTLREKFDEDLKQSMRQREELRTSVLRMAKSAIKNKEIEIGKALDDADVIKVLGVLVKQRRDSADQFRKGNRVDLADKEEREIEILQSYLPAAPSAAELERVVEDTIRELGATGSRDMGKVMKAVMEKLHGAPVDGKRVNELVRSKLGN